MDTQNIGPPEVTLHKMYHRDAWRIGMRFDYNVDIYQKIKALQECKYSKTHRCMYLPYTKKAFAAFKALGINYKTLTKDVPLPVDTSRTRPSPQPSELPAIIKAAPTKVGRKSAADIPPPGDDKIARPGNITWQNNHFFINITYQKAEVAFLKRLYGCHWNKAQQLWVCKATSKNLVAIQDRYAYWDASTLQSLEDLTRRYSSRPKVVLKAIPNDLSKLEIKIWQAGKAVEWVKKIHDRVYDAENRRWLIPRNRKIVERFVELCKTEGYNVSQMLSWETIEPLPKSRDKSKWLKIILQKVPPQQLPVMKRYAEAFVRENYSFQTMKVYCSAFQRFLYDMGAETDIDRLPMKTIEDHLSKVAASKVSYNVVNRQVSAIKFYYEKLGGWSTMRLGQLRRPKQPKTLPYILSIGEVCRLFATVDNLKHKTLLYLTYGCGLRAGEVVHLQLRDIMMDRGQIFIRGAKGKKDRVVMLPKVAIPLIQAYVNAYRPDRWVFPGRNRERPYSKSSFAKVYKRALKSAGLDTRHKLHNLRHSFATHLMESGTQQRLIQKLLGHQSSKTTEIYTQISRGGIESVESPLDKLGLDMDEKTGQKGGKGRV